MKPLRNMAASPFPSYTGMVIASGHQVPMPEKPKTAAPKASLGAGIGGNRHARRAVVAFQRAEKKKKLRRSAA